MASDHDTGEPVTTEPDTSQPGTAEPGRVGLERAATSVSFGRLIDAPAQALFDLVADPTMHSVIDGSGTVRGARSGRSKLGPGDRFSTRMRFGVPYVISNRVVEYEEGRLIAWAHVGGWRWRWEFEPRGEGTLVAETFDWSTAAGGSLGRGYVERMGFPDRNADSLGRTLERLEAYLMNTGRLS